MQRVRKWFDDMTVDSILFELSAIIVGAAVLGTLFLYARQPIIIAYIAIGFLIGPGGLGLVQREESIDQMAHFGVLLLLFIIGLNLQPDKLIKLFSQTFVLTAITSMLFTAVATAFALLAGLGLTAAIIFGVAMMFSSTVISLKLIPTTTLHHRRTGEIMTSVLLLQDVMAIVVILFITGEDADHTAMAFMSLILKLVIVWLAAFAGVRWLIIPLLNRFDTIQEYTFVATLAWCLLWAEAAHYLGLSYEMGAFIAGLSIASHQISLFLADNLKPLREFFLIMFFFAVGAKLDFHMPPVMLLAATLFGGLLVLLKAWAFKHAFSFSGESRQLSRELAARLSQASEFSLLVAFSAVSAGLLSNIELNVIQVTTIVTFVISTYWVVLKYPTPIRDRSKND